jgi:diguanylate cyclase (GGDEF)-like protein
LSGVPTETPILGEDPSSDELAKAWLLRVVERTPLSAVGDVQLDLLTRDAPRLIDGILRELGAPAGETRTDLADEARERVQVLGRLRHGEQAPAEIPRDVAALQTLLIESLRRDIPEQRAGDFARSVERLAEIFGSIQATVTETLVRERSGEARSDGLTGLPGYAELHEWLRILLAEHRRYGHPFAVSLVDIEGLGRINEGYGRRAGDRLLAVVATVIRNQIRSVDRPFRVGDDEFCVLAPHSGASQARPAAERLTQVIEGSQSEHGPRIAIAVGIAACPENGDEPDRLLEVAEEATYAAKAAGQPVAVAASRGPVPLQDR